MARIELITSPGCTLAVRSRLCLINLHPISDGARRENLPNRRLPLAGSRSDYDEPGDGTAADHARRCCDLRLLQARAPKWI